ncbi:MAG: patatin-like phospholipase family protein [Verrucomicrobia bacterium]|nr:patatin-like phospholipase family protein [Verrucomicrobiota bacterium]MDE3099947.1 patatin-like phospholipase family protein [Verrucomicrobiota bacterium]
MNLERPISKLETTRVITLAFLSARLPSALLAEHVARSLCAETDASVVLVRLARPFNGNGANPPAAPPALPSEIPRTDAGYHFLSVGSSGELQQPDWIPAVVEKLRREFRYVLIEAVADDLFTPALFEFLVRSDMGYLFLGATSEDVYHLDLLLRELRDHPDSGVDVKPVLCLHEGQIVNGFDALIERVSGQARCFVRGCPRRENPSERPGNWFRGDIRRLAREIGSCLVGLALSSGAAKGLSHIGVIQVLEENGIDVDVVAGSSMGAYIGAIWNSGRNGKEMEEIAREMESRWAFWSLIDVAVPPRQGFVRGLAVKRRLQKSIGRLHFGELIRPLYIVATNLATLERVTFKSGEVADAVHASVAVPGVCVPVTLAGETYVDGGIVDPLPVDVLREEGVDRVIAVNAIPTPDRIKYCLQAERELAQLKKRSAREIVRKLIPVDEHLNYFARGNILDILMRSIHGAQICMSETLARGADIVLRPRICDDRWLDFRSPRRFIEAGRQIAERHLPEIKALVERNTGASHELAPGKLARIA